MRRLYNAFFYSMHGFLAAWRDEPAFRLEIFLGLPLALLAPALAPDATSLAMMWGSLLLVLIVELVNTAVEAVVDLAVDGERRPLAKKAKDTASAAVLVALIVAGMTWCVILLALV